MLDVVERDSGKIIVHKEVGEPFEHSIELVDGGNARIARLSKWVDGEAKPIGWWDPVGNKPIADPGQIKPPWDYEVTRPEDRSHYDVARVSDGKKIGSITVPGEVHASQDWIMLGRHGMATYCGSGFAIYDLRTLTLAAWITGWFRLPPERKAGRSSNSTAATDTACKGFKRSTAVHAVARSGKKTKALALSRYSTTV